MRRSRSALTWVATSALTLVAAGGVAMLASHGAATTTAHTTHTTTTLAPPVVAKPASPARPPIVVYHGDGAEGDGSYVPGASSDN